MRSGFAGDESVQPTAAASSIGPWESAEDRPEIAEALSHAQALAYARELRDLYRAARNRASRFRLLVETGKEMTNTSSLEGLLQLAVGRAAAFSGHEGGTLLLMTGPDGPLERRASSGQDTGCQPDQLHQVEAWQALRERRPLTLDRADGRRGEGRPATSGPTGSSTYIPLITSDGRPLGVLALRSSVLVPQVGPEESDMLQLLASQLAAMIESVQLRERLQRGLAASLAIHEVNQVLGSTMEMEQVGRQLLETARSVFGLEAGVITLSDGHRRPRTWQTVGPELLCHWAQRTSAARGARRSVLLTGMPRSYSIRRASPPPTELAACCLPLRVQDRVIGVIELFGTRGAIRDAPVDILVSLANHAAAALENARLYRELADRERRLHDLVGRMIAAQEEERRRVAYDLHDGLAQVAASAHQHLQAFAHRHRPRSPEARRELDRVLQLAQMSVGEARRAIANLRPTVLDDFGLEAALQLQIEALRSEGWEITYDTSLGADRLPLAIEVALFRIAQEALTNVRKHAGATRVRLVLRRRSKTARLEVQDWGCGFRPTDQDVGSGPGERMGILGMQERVALLGGRCSVRSRPGGGTRVVAEVPLP